MVTSKKHLIRIIAIITVLAFTVTNCGLGYALDNASKLRQVSARETTDAANSIGKDLNPQAVAPAFEPIVVVERPQADMITPDASSTQVSADAAGRQQQMRIRRMISAVLLLATVVAGGLVAVFRIHSYVSNSGSAQQTALSGPVVAGSDVRQQKEKKRASIPKPQQSTQVSVQEDIYELAKRMASDRSALDEVIRRARQQDVEAFYVLIAVRGDESVRDIVNPALSGFDLNRIKRDAERGNPRAIVIALKLSSDGVSSEAAKGLKPDVVRLRKLASGGDCDAAFALAELSAASYQGAKEAA